MRAIAKATGKVSNGADVFDTRPKRDFASCTVIERRVRRTSVLRPVAPADRLAAVTPTLASPPASLDAAGPAATSSNMRPPSDTHRCP